MPNLQRIANFWTPYGAMFYKDMDTDMIAWIMSVAKNVLLCDTVNIPTESKSQAANFFTFDKLHVLCDLAVNQGLQPMVWLDKWWYSRPIDKPWFEHLYREFGTDCLINLAQELDLLWINYPIAQRDVLDRFADAYHLALKYLPPQRIYAGGAQPDGAIAIAREMEHESTVTLTAWYPTQQAWPVLWPSAVQFVVSACLAYMKSSLVAQGRRNPVCLIELGWRQNEANGTSLQAEVIRKQMLASRDLASIGLWTIIDDGSYGVLNVDGSPREDAIASWLI